MITTNVVVYNNTHLLAHSFCGLGIWTQLIWVINLGFYKAAINMSARAMVSSEAWLGKNPLLLADSYLVVVGQWVSVSC